MENAYENKFNLNKKEQSKAGKKKSYNLIQSEVSALSFLLLMKIKIK